MNIPVLIIAIVLLSSCAMPPAGLQRGKDALLDRDYAAAFREFQPLAEQGNAEAQFHLGNFYITGKGAPQDYATGAEWHRRSAEQGYAKAQHNLGVAYAAGQGVPLDLEMAAKWFQRAAERGLAEAQLSLGNSYFLGEGVPQNYIYAHMWLNLSVSGGNERASEILDFITSLMIPEQIAEAQRLAAECLKNDYKGCSVL